MLKGADAEIISIRKREDLAGFVKGILEKCERKDYPILGQMDDIIRGPPEHHGRAGGGEGRAGDARAVRASGSSRSSTRAWPMPASIRYPRYHIIVEDTLTGLTHEWQIGTKATSTLYETTGHQDSRRSCEAAASKLGKHFRTDIHDIEYDIFQAVQQARAGRGRRAGHPALHRPGGGCCRALGRGRGPHARWGRTSRPCTRTPTVCCESSSDRKGGDYVAGLLH